MEDMTDALTSSSSSPATEHVADPTDAVPDRRVWATRAVQVLTGALALFLISSGAAKFAGGHVFQYIEHRSGIDVFHPFANHVVGVAEVLAGVFILFGRTRLAGSMIASVVMVGAVAFHLSPWLGVSAPTGLTDGATAPWTADDFTATTTAVPFVLAIVTGIGSLLVLRHAWRSRTGTPTAAAPAV